MKVQKTVRHRHIHFKLEGHTVEEKGETWVIIDKVTSYDPMGGGPLIGKNVLYRYDDGWENV